MSHSEHCPDPYIAEREGRRAGEDGYRSRYSNPYRNDCEEAADRWDRGYRSGEYAREEREVEEQRERLARERRYQAEQQEHDYDFEQERYGQEDEAQASREYQEYCESAYQSALQDDLHLERIALALEAIAKEYQ